ncbi:MAG TPA: DNA-binding response regulator, partial [Microbacterium sp.]|nr:DNA-binding response regulator [Microbacterium sp.]
MRVLLVDDEVRLAEGIRRGLEAEGMTVDVAHNGVDGLWRAREQDYDVVVLDVMMP